MNATDLESLCAGWPGVASSVKWEDDLVFTVAGKMFAVYCLRGPHRERVSFKVDPQRFLELTDQPGIAPAAYMARAFWITISEPDRFARAKMAEFVRHAYDLVRAGLSKKQQAALAEKEAAAVPVKAAKTASQETAKVAPAKSVKRIPAKTARPAKPRKA
jgi:predicted DNA-binding protein (MmcQ/YjbR family)